MARDVAERLVWNQQSWILQCHRHAKPRVALADGVTISVRGEDIRIHKAELPLRQVELARIGGSEIRLLASGTADKISRQVKIWLLGQARKQIVERVGVHAVPVDRRVSKITIRDQRSRWDSCSSRGSLSFSRRLIMATPDVLDYVCARGRASGHDEPFAGVLGRGSGSGW